MEVVKSYHAVKIKLLHGKRGKRECGGKWRSKRDLGRERRLAQCCDHPIVEWRASLDRLWISYGCIQTVK